MCLLADHSFFGTEWQKRWCALSIHTFYYYGNEKGILISIPDVFMYILVGKPLWIPLILNCWIVLFWDAYKYIYLREVISFPALHTNHDVCHPEHEYSLNKQGHISQPSFCAKIYHKVQLRLIWRFCGATEVNRVGVFQWSVLSRTNWTKFFFSSPELAAWLFPGKEKNRKLNRKFRLWYLMQITCIVLPFHVTNFTVVAQTRNIYDIQDLW